MFIMAVPKSYWADVVLTATYLINRMSSSVLNNRSPFSLTPRVFGCIAFVHLLGPGCDKLSHHSVKCVFLGYSRTQKGYRCYDVVSHRYYTSADVTFFESSSYFSVS
uniref:Retroviral polymerase SH3-like domain-containing protein n=1 Tax=Davidia involucrata TaxID=16924 RepID=A0A5B6ZA67_DAVIN